MAARSVVPNLTPSPQTLRAEPAHAWAGAPLVPTGDNPMLDGVGPGAWADRADVPDIDFEGHDQDRAAARWPRTSRSRPRTPTRAACRWSAPTARSAARCVDLWVDKAEILFRYLEVETRRRRRAACCCR